MIANMVKALHSDTVGAKAGYLTGDKGKKPYEGSETPDVAQVALWNEFGTGNIPSRPFLRNAQKIWRQRGDKIVKALLADGTDIETICKRLGVDAQGIIKEQITRGTFTPNAPSTIRHKGSSRPLVDTGNMLQSVHWGTITKSGDKIME